MSMLFLVLLTVVFILLLLYSLLIEPFQFDIVEFKLQEKSISLRILHLSDFHLRNMGRREKELLKILEDEQYDIVMFTGDFIERFRILDNVPSFFNEIIKGKPAFGVLGNNDYGRREKRERIEKIVNTLKDCGIRILKNENAEVNDKLTVIGLDDPHKQKDNVEEAFKGVDNSRFNIVLTHSPEGLKGVLDHEPHLVLTGHTHGGQLRLPCIGAFFLNVKRKRYFPVRPGLNKINNSYVILNRGIGTTLFPARFLCKPQVIFIQI